MKGNQLRLLLQRLFMFTGCKLYMDWLLLTNPKSHNLIICYIWGWTKEGYTAYKYKERYNLAIILLALHSTLAVIGICMRQPLIINMLVNIYPCLVQLWIGYRLYNIIQFKAERAVFNNF